MSVGFNTEPYTNDQLKSYITDLEKYTTLNAEITRIQKFLVRLHRPEFLKEFPNETKESVQKLISKYSYVFRTLLAYRDSKAAKSGKPAPVVPDQIEY
jgi:hypothetical protein